MSKVSRKRWIIENVASLALAFTIVLMIRSSVIEAFKIPSGSMIPTLLVGDHIFVNKFAYGLKLPFAEWIVDDPIYLYKGDIPKRGDIIVFKYPKAPAGETIYYIKRVVGVPGDTIEVRDKQLFVNNESTRVAPVTADDAKPYLERIEESKNYEMTEIELQREKLGENTPVIMTDRSSYMTDRFGPRQVPADHLFVMGDNRDHSNDSRFWGFVPMSNVKGKAVVIWLSAWVDFSQSEFTFRPSRIGTLLH